MITELHSKVIQLLLSCPADSSCDALEIYITYNPAKAKLWEDNILKAYDNSYNYYRMAYLLGPLPYPTHFFQQIPQQLHHFKWIALYIIGKFFRPRFTLSRDHHKE